MNLKLTCCILVYIAVTLVHSKSLPKRHGHKQAAKTEKEPNKRISTQQKIGSGHAKGPMANNVQSSVPLPVVMPFPMIPFDERYPILLTPNGKPKKGREKKKDPKGETEDETDKDVDDEGDEGDKEYKAMDTGKVEKGSRPKAGKGTAGEDDDDEDEKESQNEAGRTAQKQLKVLLEEKSKDDTKEREEEDEDDGDIDEDENKKDDKKDYNEEDTAEDDSEVKDDNDDEEREGQERREEGKKSFDDDEEENEEGEEEENDTKTKSKKKKKSRERRAIYKPIVGNPEDILPYIMLGTEEEEVMDGTPAHKVATRDAEEEYAPLQQAFNEDYDTPHNIHTRDIADGDSDVESHVINAKDVNEEEEEDTPHVVNTREVNAEEEDEEEARDMRPRSLPDGRSYETVMYHGKFDDKIKIRQNLLQ